MLYFTTRASYWQLLKTECVCNNWSCDWYNWAWLCFHITSLNEIKHWTSSVHKLSHLLLNQIYPFLIFQNGQLKIGDHLLSVDDHSLLNVNYDKVRLLLSFNFTFTLTNWDQDKVATVCLWHLQKHFLESNCFNKKKWLKYLRGSLIDDTSALVQVIAWCRHARSRNLN